jgi:D-alanine-D-alanine ligase
MSQPIRVGVMRGGPNSEYEVSLATGGSVLAALRGKLADKYRAYDILIDKLGRWHIDGMPADPYDIAHRFDVIFNALHGSYGEDGKVQQILEAHGIKFTGSDSLASAVGMNKNLSKNVFKNNGLKTPVGKEILSSRIKGSADGTEIVADELFRTFPMPAVVKPMSAGSSVGVSIVRTKAELVPALREAAKHGDSVLIEEYVPGIEATVAVIEGFRGQDLYVLPVIEIRPKTKFFDYQAKYAGQSEEIVPAGFSAKVKEELAALAQKAHRALGLRHYSRSDFIISPRRGIYILEINSLPGLTEQSLVPKALRSVGSDTHELVDHLIGLALKN